MKNNGSYISVKKNFVSTFRVALEHQRKGEWAEAEAQYNWILSKNPQDPDALHLLGVLHQQTGRTPTSIPLINRAIRICPSNPNYYNSLGTSMKRNGDLKKAKHCFKKALSLNSKFPEALYNLASVYHLEKQFDYALKHYQQAIALNQKFPEAFNNMAATLNLLGRFAAAADCCQKAIRMKPDYSEPYNNMGNAYMGLCNPESAIKCYREAISLSGESPEVLCNLGNALQDTCELNKAIASYEKAIQLNPTYGKAYNNLGTTYRLIGKLKDAELLFNKCIEIRPNDAEAYHNMGNVYYDKEEYNSAASWYSKALQIDPENVRTIINLGILFQESGDTEKAIESFNKALEIDPESSKAHNHLLHELYQRCEWKKADELNASIDKFTECEIASGRVPTEMPFLSIIRTANPKANFRLAKLWSQRIGHYVTVDKQNKAYKHKLSNEKITVGYLTNNFRNHPTSHLIIDIFDFHDKDRFAINAYSYGEDDGSQYRKRIASGCDRFVDLRNMSHGQAANQIRKGRVDILVDLVGYMRGHRLEISAYRPAPIQVRWLGLAGTTGADFFDYLITDPIVTPERDAPWYSEKFIYMPDTYQVNSKPLKEPEGPINRRDLGLPEKGFVYCCFCSNYKIEPVMFRSWMQILRGVPGSVLWLLKSNAVVEENLKREARKNGVDPDRLIFAKKISKADHLQRIRIADFALDTRVVNGAATTSDVLYAGVPVLSLKGTHFASRMSASILNAIGMDELVCASQSAYEKKAIEMGRNPLAFRSLKERLSRNRIEKPLFDTQRFVRHLETAYLKIWKLFQGDHEPRIIHVDSKT